MMQILESLLEIYLSRLLEKHTATLRITHGINVKKNGMLVGILLNSGNFHLRRMEAIREAQKNPNISAIIEGLQKVKSLVSNDPVFTPPNDFVVPKNAKAIYVRGSRNA